MPCRYYLFTLVLIFLNCIPFFRRPGDYQRGLEFYKKQDLYKAAKYFSLAYNNNIKADSSLYYLYACYRALNQQEKAVNVLEEFVKIGSEDDNVYLNLFYYYRKSQRLTDLFRLLVNLKISMKNVFDKKYVVNRRLYAEIVSGAFGKNVKSDPIVFAISKGYLPVFPDGMLYDMDNITVGNLIILLDRLVEPVYPKRFFRMKNISNRSFLYLPYMRLVDLGVLEFDDLLDPARNASVSMVVTALDNLKKRNLVD
jgi:tetratricopeptide (TPR) repeat protein